MIQAPVLHVNGDDPEACARAAALAFDYRQTFHRDVVIDLVCYRRHGHNEGDDPSYTQPLMYQVIDEMRSVRKLYTETLVRRGDLTIEAAEAALDSFNARLQSVLDEVRTVPKPVLTEAPIMDVPEDAPAPSTGAPAEALQLIARATGTAPRASRSIRSWNGNSPSATPWSTRDSWTGRSGEAMAFGTLVLEGQTSA
jgi:2-oxoglutarate dehydrogenase E1 component